MPGESVANTGGVAAWLATHSDRLLVTAILGGLLAKFILILRINVNWDEFLFLEMVHQYVQGGQVGRFQTFHVHLFSWLPRLGWDEVDQVLAARFVMQSLAVGSAYLTYAIARRFVTRGGALFAVLAYLSVNAVIEHSASFRVDPIVAFLSLAALYVILCKPGGLMGAALAGAAMGLAVLVTIKSAFYLVVIAGVFWCIAPTLSERARHGFVFAVTFLAVAGALYLFHASTLAPQVSAEAGTFLRITATKVFFDGVFPRAFDLIWLVIPNPLFWVMLVEGAVIAWALVRKPAGRAGWQAFLPLVLALPVLTPVLYRNAFPYFFPFILAPAAILVGLSFEKHRRAASKLGVALVIIQWVILAFGSLAKLPDRVGLQRQTIAEVRGIFPDPVPYIEGFGVLAGYPRSGFFMSSWGVDIYRQAGQPIFADLVAKDQPPFVLADSPSLYGALAPGIEVNQDRALLPEDVHFLQENYVRHWGMLFVAGKHLQSSDRAIRIAVAGEYRLEATAPAMIDGSKVEPNGVVALTAGDHAIELSGAGEATLRWAAASRVPALAPADPLTFFHRDSWAGMTPQMMRQNAGGNLQP
jgi:hypothetical protein